MSTLRVLLVASLNIHWCFFLQSILYPLQNMLYGNLVEAMQFFHAYRMDTEALLAFHVLEQREGLGRILIGQVKA